MNTVQPFIKFSKKIYEHEQNGNIEAYLLFRCLLHSLVSELFPETILRTATSYNSCNVAIV